jgi:glycerate 2-kinase
VIDLTGEVPKNEMRVIPGSISKRFRHAPPAMYTLAEKLFDSAVKSVNPYERTRLYCGRVRAACLHEKTCGLYVAGFGKGSCPMSKAVEDHLSDLLTSGVTLTKYGHCTLPPSRIPVIEGGHPVPDKNGVNGTERIISMIRNSDEKSVILFLISGGGSALLVSPAPGLSLDEKSEVIDLLIKSGADITEVNTVRKHLSGVKGGRMADIAYPRRVISLILSDVIGDNPAVIASGPAAPDASTYREALGILERYDLLGSVPKTAIGILNGGVEGRIPETFREGDRVFSKVENIVIGGNGTAVEAALSAAKEEKLQTEIIAQPVRGEAREAGIRLAKKAIEVKKRRRSRSGGKFCLISGGETTVSVKGTGKGGRNMELALSFSMEVAGEEGITLLSAGTDGNDGPTEAAGAFADASTIKKARALGLDPSAYLDNNDSFTFFEKMGQLFSTGPTGTNVMDLQIILIE